MGFVNYFIIVVGSDIYGIWELPLNVFVVTYFLFISRYLFKNFECFISHKWLPKGRKAFLYKGFKMKWEKIIQIMRIKSLLLLCHFLLKSK